MLTTERNDGIRDKRSAGAKQHKEVPYIGREWCTADCLHQQAADDYLAGFCESTSRIAEVAKL